MDGGLPSADLINLCLVYIHTHHTVSKAGQTGARNGPDIPQTHNADGGFLRDDTQGDWGRIFEIDGRKI